LRLVVVLAVIAAAAVVWRSRHGAEVWHTADHP